MKIEIVIDFSEDVKDLVKKLLGSISAAPQGLPVAAATNTALPPVPPKKPAAKPAAPKMEVVKQETADGDDLSDVLGSDEVTPEDELDALINGGGDGGASDTVAAPAAKPAAKKAAVKPKVETAAAATDEDATPMYTLDRVKEKVKELIGLGKSTLIQDLIKKYNATGVSSLALIHYNAFMADLNTISKK